MLSAFMPSVSHAFNSSLIRRYSKSVDLIGQQHHLVSINLKSLLMNSDVGETCPLLGFVPESDRVPIQLRRTTFVVYNMTRSRAFYEAGLGMVPIYGK